MKNLICLLKVFFIVLLIAGCARPMVALKDVNENRTINKPLTKEQIKESILEGAKYAGWKARDQDADTIQATYQIRSHTVRVQIEYTDSSYSLYYKSSNDMKMYCTKSALDKKEGIVVSGIRNCPGDMPPYAIHAAYKTWIDALNDDIQTSLAGK
jgi:hypothetical protein